MKKIIFLLLVTLCFAGDLNLMFWNVENLFDISDDQYKKDGDFLPGGVKRYTYRSYCLKVQHLADVVNKINPHILAMVEVENKPALEALRCELKQRDKWRILIDDGPDIRGIDPALMYRSDKVKYCGHCYYPVFIKQRGYHSRPIMRVDLAIQESLDTIAVFINHWPSRRGGKEASDRYRNFAASVLLDAIDQTLKTHPNHRIIMTGDFNDDHCDSCLTILCENPRINYLEKRLPKKIYGTYYHNGDWIHFDHFLIANFEGAENKVYDAQIIAPYWIREKKTNGPLRFYKGAETLGGYSDHYPILLKLGLKRKYVE
ncbi:MAG: hypothetical protein K9N05_04495 [Candidatus Marinimicrobia bacterium]|nr:hypothetical protein [Candidatus Neomarinimicrobiota bacterium]